MIEIGRTGYRELSRYASGASACAIDLSDNTNRFGAPAAAMRALHELPAAAVTRYPSAYGDELKTAIAGYIGGIAAENVVTGGGSDHVLDAAIRALAEPGARLAYMEPTFSIVPTLATLNGLEPVPVPLRADHDIDAAALVATGARIIYLCSPNNPTGTLVPRASVDQVLACAPGIVILDEAYAEYAGTTWAPRAAAHDGLLVTRTLSKAFGLAGLRVGYGIGSPALVAEVEKSRGPYAVSAAAERAATAALRDDVAWMHATVAETREHRARFVRELAARGLAALPSAANFVFVPLPSPSRAAAALAARGIAVRTFERLGAVGGGVRITIAPWPAMAATLDVLGALPRPRARGVAADVG